MNKKIVLLLIVLLCAAGLMVSKMAGENTAVKKAILDGYINGIFLKGDPELVKQGWHQDCVIVVYRKGTLRKIPVSAWIERLEKKPGPLAPGIKITHKITDIKIAGNAAMVVVNIFFDGKLKYTDFMNLYKFPEGWKVITKTFYTHF